LKVEDGTGGGLEEDLTGAFVLHSRLGEGYELYLRDRMIDGNRVVEVILDE
jgi:hypothetical protein